MASERKQSRTKTSAPAHRQQNSEPDGLIPTMIDFIEITMAFYKKCKEYANEFNEPWKSHLSNMVDSSFFAVSVMFLLFFVQLMRAVFTFQPTALFEYSYFNAVAGVAAGAISFICLSAKKAFKK